MATYCDQGEGPIHAMKWRTRLIAWAKNPGIKVYDTTNDQRIIFVARQQEPMHPGRYSLGYWVRHISNDCCHKGER
ncbi:vacuolar protein sorting-associated protein 41 homolog isoform X2 [Papaver somniferum]|uniref:vacuolar protein sorting-associated protein 41 homolog isoform X2 n=1 Tax=Papaver somniferum TaxID=3469 RepID=UPI000E6F78D4|nr:vacuolar protein sorting-associated protein 41 homolog isoform X2 [Papaver somniferum]